MSSITLSGRDLGRINEGSLAAPVLRLQAAMDNVWEVISQAYPNASRGLSSFEFDWTLTGGTASNLDFDLSFNRIQIYLDGDVLSSPIGTIDDFAVEGDESFSFQLALVPGLFALELLDKDGADLIDHLAPAEISALFASAGGITFNMGAFTGTLVDVNHPPVAVDDEFDISENGTMVAGLFFVGADTDPDGDSLSVTEVNGSSANVGRTITLGQGELQVTGGQNQFFRFSTAGGYNGLAAGETVVERFTYTIDDGRGGTDIAQVRVTIEGVNDAPTLSRAAISLPSTEVNATPTVRKVEDMLRVAGWSDVDNQPLLGMSVQSTTGSGRWEFSVGGSVWTVVDGLDNGNELRLNGATWLRYLPDGLDAETATLSFRAWDQTRDPTSGRIEAASTDSAKLWSNVGSHTGGFFAFSREVTTASLQVASINDAPSNTVPASIGVTEDVTSALTGISVADVDAGISPLVMTLSVPPAGGTLAGTSGSGVTVGGSAQVLTLTGSASAINDFIAAGQVSYTPALNANGTVVLTVSTNDQGATGPGGAKLDTDVVNLNITPINDAPITSLVTLPAINEDSTSLISIRASVLLANASDPDMQPLVAYNLQASGGVVTDVGGGNWLYRRPPLNDDSSVSFSYLITDGTAVVPGSATMDLLPVNDAPVNTLPASIDVTEDMASALTGISVSDVDSRSGNLVMTLSVPAGALAATSGGNVAVGGTALSRTLTGTAGDLSNFLSTGNVTYTTAPNANGVVVLTVSTNDQGNTGSGGALASTGTVNLTISPINDAPSLTVPGSIGVTEDVASALTDISVADVDAGTGLLTMTLSVPAGTLAATADGSVTVSGSGTGSLTLGGTVGDLNNFIAASKVLYTTAPNANGSVTLTVLTNDNGHTGSGGALTDTDTVTLAITPVNDAPPVALPDSAQTRSNTAVTIVVLANDSDIDGSPLSVDSVGAAGNGSVAIALNSQSVTYTPNPGFAGFDNFSYTVSDGQGGLTSANVSVLVVSRLGTAFNDSLQGSSAVDYMLGLGGRDTLRGLGGNDTIDGGSGNDTLYGGEGNDDLRGSEGNDVIYGDAGADTVYGGAGNDWLYGGPAGPGDGTADTFVFNTALDAVNNVDWILNFEANGLDRIALDSGIFVAVAANGTPGLDAGEFASVFGGVALDANDFIVFDPTDGKLYYDADGAGAAARVQFARVSLFAGVVDASDFMVGAFPG